MAVVTLSLRRIYVNDGTFLNRSQKRINPKGKASLAKNEKLFSGLFSLFSHFRVDCNQIRIRLQSKKLFVREAIEQSNMEEVR